MSSQAEFNFEQSSAGDGLTHWVQQRERAGQRLARRLGLPLNHEVELWLKDGVRLRGKLVLQEPVLFLEAVDENNPELAVGKADFRYAEIESCVRRD